MNKEKYNQAFKIQMSPILLFILFISASSIIFSDSGQQLFDHAANFDCRNNFQTTKTIQFSGAFQNIPQVFMFQDYCDIPNAISEYQFSITSITLVDFQIVVKCPKPGLIWGIRYSWIALDDSRVQVINSFNVDPPQDKVFNHQLLNADTAIIGLTSLGYSGQLEFQLLVTQITKDTVSVGITQVAGKFVNLKQIGYQILLVASRDIIDLGLVTFKPTYTSNAINLETNKWLIQPIQGIKYNYGAQLTLNEQKTIGASTVSYSFTKWGPYDQSEFTIQNLWMSYQLIKNYALECFTLRISQKLDRSQSNRPRFFVQIMQTNQIYNTVGEYSFKVYKPIQNINFVTEINCITGKRVISKFNKCNSCSSFGKNYQFNHYCHSQINLISYFPKFAQTQSVNQEFKIIITSNNCLVKQILYNQAKTEQDIINIEFQDP
ncbi:unnamed protein product [Paramecium pentaurelia]|uniref:H-type lectin domain-containing protein n=1 Tax=Paramecium pentaurelia TaxID=43138 RepID=A0A8S1Y5V8_9CILI|nr:unnamed protein product [Paramecium pentaurelia]